MQFVGKLLESGIIITVLIRNIVRNYKSRQSTVVEFQSFALSYANYMNIQQYSRTFNIIGYLFQVIILLSCPGPKIEQIKLYNLRCFESYKAGCTGKKEKRNEVIIGLVFNKDGI